MAIRGRGDSRLKDLDMMGYFSHTGCNESLNSLHIKVIFISQFVPTLQERKPVLRIRASLARIRIRPVSIDSDPDSDSDPT
jgi:hypothetical protein